MESLGQFERRKDLGAITARDKFAARTPVTDETDETRKGRLTIILIKS